MFDLTYQRIQGRWERRRRRIRRIAAAFFLMAICGVAVFFATRQGEVPLGLAEAAVGEREAPPPGDLPLVEPPPIVPAPSAPVREAAPAKDGGAAPLALDLGRAMLQGDRLVATVPEGQAILTLLPRVQQHMSALLQRYAVPHGAFAAVEPSTGRVLALAAHSAAEPGAKPFALRGLAPAASIFKLVTAGALLEQSLLDPDQETCFRGGKRRLYKWNLQDSHRDGRCATLGEAVAWSLNAPIGKMALKHLTPSVLTGAAEAFGFNAPIPFDLEVEPSWAKVPTDVVGFGRAAAGFGDVRLSALHGALLVAAVANGGQLLRPYVVEEVRGADGAVVRRGTPEVLSIALSPAVARRIGQMMLLASSEGTARRHFRRAGRSFLGDIQVPSKTGSLFVHDPFMDYSWFVGFAPAKDPQIAFAAVVGNQLLWHIKSGYVGVEGLRKFFQVERSVGHRPPRAQGRRWRRRG